MLRIQAARATGQIVSQSGSKTIPYHKSVTVSATVKNVGPAPGYISIHWVSCVDGQPTHYMEPGHFLIESTPTDEVEPGGQRTRSFQCSEDDLPISSQPGKTVSYNMAPIVKEATQPLEAPPDDEGSCITMTLEEMPWPPPEEAPPEEVPPPEPPPEEAPEEVLEAPPEEVPPEVPEVPPPTIRETLKKLINDLRPGILVKK